jgi:hypothetical protein
LWDAGIDNARREANKLLRRFGVVGTLHGVHRELDGLARRL